MKRKIINIYTLQLFDSITETARFFGVSKPTIYNSINIGFTVKGNRFEYFEEWLKWDSKKKENYSKRDNIYFL